MAKLSVVLITFNASRKLKEVLIQASKLTNDIIVLDSGSTDNTKEICAAFEVNFQEHPWQGYGKQKNLANKNAHNDWILSIDADEVISDALIKEIQRLNLTDDSVYDIPFRNIYCGQEIKFGRWRNERHVRLFNRTKVLWDENAVHEGLIITGLNKIKLTHPIDHYSMESKVAHIEKARRYAQMGAKKLKLKGKKATFIKLYINPLYRFVKDYFISLGFMDGKLGFQLALIIAKESYWKYRNLKDLR